MFNFLIFIIFYLPFQLALNPAQGVDMASGRVLVIILFFIWLAEGLKNKKIIILPKQATLFLSVFIFLSVFSIIVSRNSDWSIRKILFLLSFLPLYFIGQALLNSAERKRKLIQALVCSAFVTAIIGIAQFIAQFIFGLEAVYKAWAKYLVVPFLGKSFSEAVLQNPSWLVNIAGKTYLRATALFPDPHMLSFFLGMTFPLAIGIFVVTKKRKTLNLIIIITILVADFLTFSRGGYLGLLVGFIFLAVVFWQKIAKKYQITIIIVSVIVLIMGLIPSPINKRLGSSFDLKEGSNRGRLETWGKALGVIRDYPWLGTGIGNYSLEMKATADYREPIYAHSTYLDIAAETGIFNGLMWALFLWVTIRGLYKSKNQAVVFGAVSITIFSVHSLTETGIYSATVLPILLIIASLNNE